MNTHSSKSRKSIHSKNPSDRFALWVGTLTERKNPQGAIDAIALVNKEMKLPLVMVGATYRGFNKAGLRVTHDGGETVRFADRVDTFAELARLYRSAVCLLFPRSTRALASSRWRQWLTAVPLWRREFLRCARSVAMPRSIAIPMTRATSRKIYGWSRTTHRLESGSAKTGSLESRNSVGINAPGKPSRS